MAVARGAGARGRVRHLEDDEGADPKDDLDPHALARHALAAERGVEREEDPDLPRRWSHFSRRSHFRRWN